VQGSKNLREPLRSTKEVGKGLLQAPEGPAVFTETGEVQIATRAQRSTSLRRQWKCWAQTASSSKASPDPNDLLQQLFTHTHTPPTQHSSHHASTPISPLCCREAPHLRHSRSCRGAQRLGGRCPAARHALPCRHYERSLLSLPAQEHGARQARLLWLSALKPELLVVKRDKKATSRTLTWNKLV